MSLVENDVLLHVHPYIMYLDSLEGNKEDFPKTPNNLWDPLLFNYRSFLADFNVVQQFKNESSFSLKSGHSRDHF